MVVGFLCKDSSGGVVRLVVFAVVVVTSLCYFVGLMVVCVAVFGWCLTLVILLVLL